MMNTAIAILDRRRQHSTLWLGMVVFAAIVVATAQWLAQADERVVYGFLASLLAGLATAVGALPIFTVKRVSTRVQDTMLGFGAGVMLAATSFSLILPGIESAQVLWDSKFLAAGIAAVGVIAGALILWGADRVLPHEHFIKGAENRDARRVKQVWLFVFAIALHNFPEGLAVGVSFGAGESGAAGLAAGVGIQNMPEGLVVALALVALGYSRMVAFTVAALTGLAEPVAGLLGAAVVAHMQPVLPFSLSFAAGAMLFVISHEIIPESHRNGHEQAATLGVTGGFVVMMLLDTALA